MTTPEQLAEIEAERPTDTPAPKYPVDTWNLLGVLRYTIESATYFLSCNNHEEVKRYLHESELIRRAIVRANEKGE